MFGRNEIVSPTFFKSLAANDLMITSTFATLQGEGPFSGEPAVFVSLSKLPRVSEYFARRPQIQERLTEQIFHALQYILETDNIAVVVNARHLCVSHRGVEDTNASTVTSKLGGAFKSDPMARSEFMNAIDLKNV